MADCILTATTNGEQQTFRLAPGEVVTFGRSSMCGFRVADANVSRQHCLMSFRDGVLEVTDLGSANDLKHLGSRKSRLELRLGDGFHAGRTYVLFAALEDAPPAVPDLQHRPASAQSESVSPQHSSESIPEDSGQAKLVSREPTLAIAPSWKGPHKAEPLPGEMLGSYRVMRLLGRSDRGSVFEAEHAQLRRRVAIKWLCEDSAEGHALSTFLADMRMAASVTSQQVLAVYDIEPDGPSKYAVLEVVDGNSLAESVGRGSRLSCEEVIDILSCILRALVDIHAHNCVHGGVKPENIFVLRRGGAKLSDLRASPRLRPKEWACCAAPELLAGRGADVRSDLYSVGAVAFASITGGLAIASDHDHQVAVRAILSRDTSLPTEFVDWVCAMTAIDPSWRPASAQEAMRKLWACAPSEVAASRVLKASTPAVGSSPISPKLPTQSAILKSQVQARSGGQARRPQASAAKVFFARLTAETIIFALILGCGIALLLLLKIKWPEFDIYRLIEGVGGR